VEKVVKVKKCMIRMVLEVKFMKEG